MPYTYRLTTTIPASPEEIYEAWLDSLSHSEMTGADAVMSDVVGAEVSAWDRYITGRNIELIPGERIVQSWRTSEFDEEHEDSIVTIVLQETDDGTLLTLEHANVPDEQRSYEEGGWQSNYFEPMVAYFSERSEEAPEAAPLEAPQESLPEAPPRPAAKRSVKRARKAASKTAGKNKQAASAKPKRAAPRPKAAPKRRKGASKGTPRRTAAAARKGAKPAARKGSRPAARKPGRGKRR